MATIDVIVLGILDRETLSAYDIQKIVEYRNISKWVKISSPSIYKKVLQLEEKGFIQSVMKKDRNMSKKAVYSLTEAGKKEFEKLMLKISCDPIRFFLDFNAVIVNLDLLPIEQQKECVKNIEKNVQILKAYLEENMLSKEHREEIPETGMAVLRQQLVLTEAIESWLDSVKKRIMQS